MEVIPAIDLRDGKCVRLYQGDYGQETVYSDNPVEMARHWVSLGATRLHVIDLDGAKAGIPANTSVVENIVTAVSTPVQLGGGIRTAQTARLMLALGVDRVLIGTAAIENPDIVRRLCDEFGAERVVITVDARDGYVAVKGWTADSQKSASALIEEMEGQGIGRFMYTDIGRDGTLTEPNFDAIESLLLETQLRMLAAGGIASVGHLVRLAELGVEGAIVGTAIYTGDIELRTALKAVNG